MWLVDCNSNSVTSMLNTVTSACSSQCRYFAIVSKECYVPRLHTVVTCVDGQMCCNSRGMVQCYGMLRITVILHSNFLYFVTLSQTTLVTWHSSRAIGKKLSISYR